MTYPLKNLIHQRSYRSTCGYEEANDADTLWQDPLLTCAMERAPEQGAALGRQPTFSRLENIVSRLELLRVFAALVRPFVQQHLEAAVL